LARAVEAKLNLDPAVRAEADQMKRAWELLDHLPRPEPKPGFAGRTMDRLTALRPLEARARRWRALLAWAAAIIVAAGCGFTACWLIDRRGPADDADKDIARDLRLLQHLPTYELIDDVGQLAYLAQPDLFGDDLVDPLPPAAPGALGAGLPTPPDPSSE